MGGKASGGGLGGGAGKSGGGGPVIAPGQAGGAAGVTGMRQQRLADAVKKVGVRSGAAGGLTSPPSPRVRPTGPGGPGTPPPGTDPLLGRDPLNGAVQPYGRSVPGGPVPPGAGAVLPEGMAASPLAGLFTSMSPGGPPAAGADAEARMKRAKQVADFYGTRL
jgi:hypothetical protein